MSSRCILWILGAVFLVGLAQAQDPQRNRCHPVELQMVGPLQSVVIHCGKAGETRIDVPLLAGESRTLQVPLPVSAGLVDPLADVTLVGSGMVRWPEDRVLDVPKIGSPSRLPLPVVPTEVPVLSSAGLLGLIALALVLFFLRRRSPALVAASLLGSTALFVQVGLGPQGEEGYVRIIEIQGAALWKVLDSSKDSMAHTPGQSVRLVVTPPSQPLRWHVTEPDGELSMVAHSKGALLRKEFAVPAGMRGLESDLNALGNLEQMWVREPSGLWTARGPWPLGTALSADGVPAPGPPSWLVDALPQGPTIWVARVAPGVQPLGMDNPATETWLRIRLDT